MYVLAMTGGLETPSFIGAPTLEALKSHQFYRDLTDMVDAEQGDRVDVLHIHANGQVEVIESHTGDDEPGAAF